MSKIDAKFYLVVGCGWLPVWVVGCVLLDFYPLVDFEFLAFC